MTPQPWRHFVAVAPYRPVDITHPSTRGDQVSRYQVQAGDRVRVTLEGPVRYVGYTGFAIGDKAGPWSRVADRHVVEFEKLPDPEPEPEWQPGDVVRDASGNVFFRVFCGDHNDCPWVDTGHLSYRDMDLELPLTALVRDGKPVTE